MIEGQQGVTWEDWVALAEACERLWFEALFRSDHYLSVMGQAGGGSPPPAGATWRAPRLARRVEHDLRARSAHRDRAPRHPRLPRHLPPPLRPGQERGHRRPHLG